MYLSVGVLMAYFQVENNKHFEEPLDYSPAQTFAPPPHSSVQPKIGTVTLVLSALSNSG